MLKKNEYDSGYVVKIAIAASVILTFGIYLVSMTLGRFQSTLLPDTGAAWYYWKLPKPELWASLTAWVLYIVHQVTIWVMAVRLSRQKIPAGNTVTRLNIQVLVVNVVFIILHMIQTALFYDGLAQQVPVFSSQYSVIVMLVMILILFNNRRGLFFGKKVKLPKKGLNAIFKIHGYFIAWALVYTFWFHPTEGTWGHLMGFFYMFLLFIQLSLANTRFHLNVKWISLLEIYVAFHGAIVAVEAGGGMWPMFLFGFLMMFIVTGSHGVIKKKSIKVIMYAVYAALVLLVYTNIIPVGKSIGDIHQITWIPIILYLLVFVLVWFFNGGAVLLERLKTSK